MDSVHFPEAVFLRRLAVDPVSIPDWLGLGRNRLGYHKEGSVCCFNRALLLNPSNPEASVQLALLARHDQSSERCRHFLHRAVVTAPDSTALYRTAVEALQVDPKRGDFMNLCRRWYCLDPLDPAAAMFFAFAAEQLGFLQVARRYHSEAVCLAPERLEATLSLADVLFLDATGPAGQWYARALELDSSSAKVRCNFSVFLQSINQFLRASELADQAFLLQPDLSAAALNLAGVEVERGQAERAVRLLFQAEKLDPSSAVVKSNLGFLLLFTGRFSEGWRFHEWRSLMPTDSRPANAVVVRERVLSDVAVVH